MNRPLAFPEEEINLRQNIDDIFDDLDEFISSLSGQIEKRELPNDRKAFYVGRKRVISIIKKKRQINLEFKLSEKITKNQPCLKISSVILDNNKIKEYRYVFIVKSAKEAIDAKEIIEVVVKNYIN